MFLFQSIEAARDFGGDYKEIPEFVTKNLNSKFELRPYQIEAFRHFITFYEIDKRPNPTQVLFHMATGSGKTLIMAGLIIYLYSLGYRNFLFFVNLDNIVKKTKDNFLNATSAKYLFAEEIIIDGEPVRVEISSIKETYEGTADFIDKKFNEVFHNKTLHITDPHGEGEGISQYAPAIRQEWKIDLSQADWFVFNDNYGTTEEKAFVAYFASYVEELRKVYDEVYLVRNERQLVLYSFDGGERFEPDYLMLLRKKNVTGYEQYQIFVEPKGKHLLDQDKWKEDFLLQIESKGFPTKTFVDDTQYHVWGFPFYNHQQRMEFFTSTFERILSS